MLNFRIFDFVLNAMINNDKVISLGSFIPSSGFVNVITHIFWLMTQLLEFHNPTYGDNGLPSPKCSHSSPFMEVYSKKLSIVMNRKSEKYLNGFPESNQKVA